MIFLVGSLLPVPSECSSTSELVPIVPLHQQTQQITDSTINYLAQLLNASMIELNEVEQKHGDEEINDLNLDEMSGVVMAIHRVDPHALNVDREYSADNVLQFDQGVAKLVDEVTSGNSEEFITQEIQRVNMNQTPSHSEVAVEEPVKGEVAEIKNEQPHDDHHKRKKKDEVVELYDSLTGYFDPSSRRRQHVGIILIVLFVFSLILWKIEKSGNSLSILNRRRLKLWSLRDLQLQMKVRLLILLIIYVVFLPCLCLIIIISYLSTRT